MKNLSVLNLALSLLIMSCCDTPKDVSAGVSASKTTVLPNESVSLTANGTYDHVKWTFPDGQSSTSKFADFSASDPGTYAITLTAYSRKKGHSDQATVNIKVIEPTAAPDGQLMIWTANINNVGLQVSIDGTYVGQLTGYYPGGIGSNPCGSAYCVTTSLAPGKHVVTITMGSYSNNGTATVISGQCAKFQIY